MIKIICSLMILLLACSCAEQGVHIPDANFKQALLKSDCIDTDGDGKVDSNVDTNKDGKIQITEIENLEILDVNSKNINSLEGIQYFVNLKKLNCYKNNLTSLDITKQTKLEILFCFDNKLENLDLSQNPMLIEVGCRGNMLTSLDLRNNKVLRILYCYRNSLISLNLKNGNNINMSTMWSFDNPSLHCIEIDDVNMGFSECNREDYSGWCKDSAAVYRQSCE